MEIEKILIERLLKEAEKAGEKSYSPYSHFRVGAAVLSEDNKIFTGCNIENRSYPVGVCAEIVALGNAVSQGVHDIKAVAVVGLDAAWPLAPCGLCRQFMSEFSREIIVIMGNRTQDYIVSNLRELLPQDSLTSLIKKL